MKRLILITAMFVVLAQPVAAQDLKAGSANYHRISKVITFHNMTLLKVLFIGFKADEINSIEEYFVAFSGYRKHRPIKVAMRTAEYWYETISESARLNRNLRKMLDHMDVKGRVTFAGSEFRVEKITLRSK